jgi:DNA-3-methyladenine glycosylase II
MNRYRTLADLDTGIAHILAAEPRFTPIVVRSGTPSLRSADPGFEGLLTIITEQFLSLSAAAAIWNRIKSVIEPFNAETVLATPNDELKSLGLSQAKIKSFLAIAHRCNSGALDFNAIAAMDDGGVREALLALPGVGPWTVDIYLLSNLGRTDAWPAGDLALQVAAQNLLALEARPSPKQMDELARNWQPHRAAAARLLWAHYRNMKGMTQA